MYIYIYIYIYIKASPLPPAPLGCRELLAGWLLNWVTFSNYNCNFGDLEALFGVPWVTILVIQGSIFIDFRVIWGASWVPPWAPFCDFALVWGVKMGNGFRVHVFGDPGMEIIPECSGCMCYNHGKNNGCGDIPLFQWWSGGHLSWLAGLLAWVRLWVRSWSDFEIEARGQVEGNVLIQGGSKLPASKHSGCEIQASML